MNVAYETHPAADCFPLIQGTDFEELVEDIRTQGLLEPVVLDPDGLLIDGRNRVRACEAAGVEVRTTVHEGDVLKFVTAHNLLRRHLTDSQRAMSAAKLANLPRGNPNLAIPPHGGIAEQPLVSRSKAKALMHVSEGSINRAKIIQRQGTPELQALVHETGIPLASAVRVSELPVEDQDEYVAQVKAGADPVKAAPSRPPTKSDPKTRLVGTELAERIEELAAQGYTSQQIAERTGLGEAWIRKTARVHDIDVQADRISHGRHRIDANRVLTTAAESLSVTAFSLSQINTDDLNAESAQEWIDSLTESMTALRQAIKKIKESIQ